MGYEPPFNRTTAIDNLCMEIAEMVGSVLPSSELGTNPVLHRRLRIRTIHSSLLIEGNSLSEDEVVAVLDGKLVRNWVNQPGWLTHSYSMPPESIRSAEHVFFLHAQTPDDKRARQTPCPFVIMAGDETL